MFIFKKKDIMTEEEKNMIKSFCIFYEINKSLFLNICGSQKEKKEIIKNAYSILDYSNIPVLSDNYEDFSNGEKLYRGISAENQELLNKYVNDLLNGEPFYGGRASIYGTGIYTVIGNNSNIADKYASDGGINKCGIVIESVLTEDARIIKSSKIDNIRTFLFSRLRKIYSNKIENYLEVLQDDGLFAAILGYDAIFVEEKNYMVVLNRQKMVVNSKYLNNIEISKENYSKK